MRTTGRRRSLPKVGGNRVKSLRVACRIVEYVWLAMSCRWWHDDYDILQILFYRQIIDKICCDESWKLFAGSLCRWLPVPWRGASETSLAPAGWCARRRQKSLLQMWLNMLKPFFFSVLNLAESCNISPQWYQTSDKRVHMRASCCLHVNKDILHVLAPSMLKVLMPTYASFMWSPYLSSLSNLRRHGDPECACV